MAIVTGNKAAADIAAERMVLLDWALEVLCAYPLGEVTCTGQWNSTDDDICCAIKLADPCCVGPGCGEASPPVQNCEPIITLEVLSAVDVDQREAIELAGPSEGDRYLVVSDSGGTGWTLNTHVEWVSGAWVSTPVINAQNFLALDTGLIWTTRNGIEPGLLFPTVTATFVGVPGTIYILQSDYPQVSLNMNRTVMVEIMNGSDGWYLAYQGPETSIGYPIPFNVTGLNMQNIRSTYTLGECSWEAGGGSIEPPGCVFPGDHSCDDHGTTDHF